MKKLNELENYKDVKDGYFITTCGKVVSTVKSRLNTKGYLIMAKFVDRDGYSVCFPRKKDGKTKTVRVCRVLASAYIENKLNKPFVDHIDRVRSNDSLNNLRWVTAKENCENSEYVYKKLSKFRKIDVIKDGVVIDSLTGREISEKYSLRRTSIYAVLCSKSRSKSIKGYGFKYTECND